MEKKVFELAMADMIFSHKNIGCCLIGHVRVCNLAAASKSIHTPGIDMLYLVFDLKQKPSSFA